MSKIIEFKAGDRVHYVSKAHGQSSANPLLGSKYYCEGFITNTGNVGSYIEVDWDNGTHNSYTSGDLEHVNSQTNPNIAFRLKKQHKRR